MSHGSQCNSNKCVLLYFIESKKSANECTAEDGLFDSLLWTCFKESEFYEYYNVVWMHMHTINSDE